MTDGEISTNQVPGMPNAKCISLVVLFLSWFAATSQYARAAIAPTFDSAEASWAASDIVVVDDRNEVQDVWKGGLAKGVKLTLPPESGQGDRVLFLVNPVPGKSPTGHTPWKPAEYDFYTSTIWFKMGRVMAVRQPGNDGPQVAQDLYQSILEFRNYVGHVLTVQAEVTRGLGLHDPEESARELAPFALSDIFDARAAAFRGLANCGPAALPILRGFLNDPAYEEEDWHVIPALAKAGGPEETTEFIQIINLETRFWVQLGPTLKVGWWNEWPTRPGEYQKLEHLRNRYGKLCVVLRALEGTNDLAVRAPLQHLRDFWRSLPQLNDRSGISEIADDCDTILGKLPSAALSQGGNS